MAVRKRLIMMGIATILLCLVIAPGPRTFAKGTDGFELSVAEAGDVIAVTVTLTEAKDLYAYDLVLTFDPVRLAFQDSKITLPGFTVKPLLERGELRLAHTSVGDAAGRNGKVELASTLFNRLRGGDAVLSLETVKLVDSKLEMRELAPDIGFNVKSGKAVHLPSDVIGHWSAAAVREAMELGFATGFEDGTFRPDAPVTRQEATVLLAKAMLVKPQLIQATSFRDAANIPPWALPYVSEAVRSNWVGGYEDGTFRGGNPIARQEFAAIAIRAANVSLAWDATALTGFADRHRVAPWAAQSMALSVELGILRGQSGGLLNPQATTTRAEAVTMILRLLHSDSEEIRI
ncbi:MAG: S-layer domain protein [Paenibacillus sp.]|nr:S-layer domain protein [Paenibacillus sp.]